VKTLSMFTRRYASEHRATPHALDAQLLSRGNADTIVLQAKVARVHEAIAIAEVAHAAIVLAAKASAREAAAAHDSATFCIREAEDRVAMGKQEASEQESRAEVEHLVAFA
jgi:hypothetical protein